MKQNRVPRIEYIIQPKGKTNPYGHDVQYGDLGQLRHPGQVTKIPGNTMSTEGYGNIPLWTVPNVGPPRMVYPNTGNQFFAGADNFIEYPIANAMYGGDPSLTNIEGHYPFGGQNTKTHTHMKGGGSLNRKVTCSNCGWSWKLVDGGTDPMTCHKCGGTIKMQNGGWLDSYDEGGDKNKDLRSASDNTRVVQRNFPKSIEEANAQGKKTIEYNARKQAEQIVAERNAEAKEAKYQKDLKKGNVPWYMQKIGVMNNTPEEKIKIKGELAKLQTIKNQRTGQEKFDDAALEVITSVIPELPLLKYLKPTSKIAEKALEKRISDIASKGKMYGENQVLTQQSRLLDPEIKAKFFEHQAPQIKAKIQSNILGEKLWKQPKDYGNRITPENYDDFVKNIHGSTEYDLAANSERSSTTLGLGDYGKPGMVYSDAPLNNLGKDIVNAHEKNHGMFVGTLSKEMSQDLLKPFGTNKPVPFYGAKAQPDEVLARMAQFKNAIGMSDNQPFTLGHLNLIRKNYANSFLDNGITEMLNKIKPGSSGEKHFLNNMNKYAFGVGAPAAIGASALQEEEDGGWLDGEYRRGGQKRKKYTSKNIQSSVNDLFRRNETLFGPAGKKRYKPGLKYKDGGNWLDNLH